MNRNSNRSFGTFAALLPTSKIEELSKKIAIGENHREVVSLHERMMEMARKMRLNLSNPNSYKKVLAALSK